MHRWQLYVDQVVRRHKPSSQAFISLRRSTRQYADKLGTNPGASLAWPDQLKSIQPGQLVLKVVSYGLEPARASGAGVRPRGSGCLADRPRLLCGYKGSSSMAPVCQSMMLTCSSKCSTTQASEDFHSRWSRRKTSSKVSSAKCR